MTPTEPDGRDATAATVVADIVRDLLAREGDRKTSLEQRGLVVITTSSALGTLVFAIATLVTKRTRHTSLIGSEEVFVMAGLGLFVVAGVLGILTNVPRRGLEITADQAREYLLMDHADEVARSATDKSIERSACGGRPTERRAVSSQLHLPLK